MRPADVKTIDEMIANNFTFEVEDLEALLARGMDFITRFET